MKLRSHLLVLMIGTLLPMIIFLMVGAWWLTERERITFERGITERVHAVSIAVDNELRSSITTLVAVAALHRVEAGDLREIHVELQRVLRSQPEWLALNLSDLSGQQLINGRFHYGRKLPAARDRVSFEQVLQTRHPAVGDLIATSDKPDQQQFAIRVPVLADGEVKFVLTAAVKPQVIRGLMEAQRLPQTWIGGVVDRNGRFVARTANQDATLGQPASENLRGALSKGREGWYRGTTVEGLDVYTAFHTSDVSGWSVAVGIPTSEVDAARRGTMLSLFVGTALAGLIAAMVALWLGRRFSAPIASLASAARGLGHNPWPSISLKSQVDEVRDLTVALEKSAIELQRADQAQRFAIEQLRSTDRAKDEFLAMLGHELRNPLAAIAGASSVLSTPGVRDDMAGRAQAILRRQLENLSRLVDDMLDVSRTTTGKVALIRRPLDLAAIVGAALNAFRSSGRSQRHHVTSRLDPAWIDADNVRIEQIVSNLLDNAVKFTPPGGRILVEVAGEGNEAVLRVTDSGVGIDAGVIGRVFDSFVQGGTTIDRAQGGLGLGLALVRALTQLHGGSVAAESAGPGQGSVFTVRFPRIQEPTLAVTAGAGDADSKGTRRRILIIEDNRDGREMLKTLLTLAGHEVHESEDGQIGVAAAATLAPDIVLIDIGLPGIDGYEVARRIRAGRGGTSMRLIALTGYGQPDDRRLALEAGFDVHLTKPVGIERLNEFLLK